MEKTGLGFLDRRKGWSNGKHGDGVRRGKEKNFMSRFLAVESEDEDGVLPELGFWFRISTSFSSDIL